MENYMQNITDYVSANGANWLAAAVILIVGYFIALFVRWGIAAGINRTGFGAKAKATGGNIGRSIGQAAFWIILLVFILSAISRFPLVADQLGFLNNMMDEIFAYLPKLVTGAIILGVGVMLAKVIKNVISSTLEVAQVDNLAARYNIGSTDSPASISSSIAKIVSTIVVIMFGITAIGIWDIPGISQPVSEMLDLVLSYIPKVLGAAIIIGISIFIGRFVSNLAETTLPAMGLDRSLSAIEGLDGDTAENFKPSKMIGTIAMIAIALMGLTAAMTTLDIPALSSIFATLLAIGGKIVLGAVIIGAGVFIANVVAKLITPAIGQTMSNIVRYIVILLITFMGLSEMGLGDGIVESAFNWGLGAAAVAGAIAFGLGGREWAKAKLHDLSPVGRKTAAKK